LRKTRRFSIDQQRGMLGVLFLSPWMLGFLFLFAIPLFDSLRYSFSELVITPTGFTQEYLGFANYRTALLENPYFNRNLADAVLQMVVDVPLIIFFSLFTATLLNQKFKGRGFARAIFFLPVILASGIIDNLANTDAMSQMITSATEGGAALGMLQSFELERMMIEAGVNRVIVDYLTGSVDRIYEIISASGVQILIFLAGLQSISPSLYEASKMEGATGYEAFWKITFPMVSPLILTNIIYSVIDSFSNNQVATLIHQTAFNQFNFGLSAAMAWVYFILIALILFVVAKLISKKVFYYD